jgi:hypothetical protein
MANKPKYNISTSMNEKIIEIVITGEATEDCIENLKNEVNIIVKLMTPEKLLADFRALKIPRVLSESFSSLRNYPPLFHIKTAVVDIPENAYFQSFQETTAINAGLTWEWFTDINAARAWLKGK